jgi:hypothetical protein
MKTYRFSTDLQCFLADGKVTELRRYDVAVEADSAEQAREHLRSIATEMVHDAGSQLLDAPLDYLDVRQATLIGADDLPSVTPRDRRMLYRR